MLKSNVCLKAVQMQPFWRKLKNTVCCGSFFRLHIVWDQWTGTSNRECARAAGSRAKIDMRVSRVHRCAGNKFYLPVAL